MTNTLPDQALCVWLGSATAPTRMAARARAARARASSRTRSPRPVSRWPHDRRQVPAADRRSRAPGGRDRRRGQLSSRGQPPLAAYLLPLSIDGLVATSSLVLLRSARTGVSAPWLARAGLVLAVVATLAANVASGAQHGWPGALLAGWPAVAFVISAETAIAMSRRRAAKVATERP